jgi:hypothetical protein
VGRDTAPALHCSSRDVLRLEWVRAQSGEATPGATGALEVQVVDGPLLHSKLNGDGYVDSADKMTKILTGLGEAGAK